eukprot:g1291.t1
MTEESAKSNRTLLYTAIGLSAIGLTAGYLLLTNNAPDDVKRSLAGVIMGVKKIVKKQKKRTFSADLIIDDICLGSMPQNSDLGAYSSILSVCEEWEISHFPQDLLLDGTTRHRCIPVVDYFAPTMEQMRAGANFLRKAIESRKERNDSRPILVHCKGGKGRSLLILLAYILETHRPLSANDAMEIVRKKRPVISRLNKPYYKYFTPQGRCLAEFEETQL